MLFDFGGVLTSSVRAAFESYGATLGDSSVVLRTLSRDRVGAELLVAHEEGRLTQAAFEAGFSARLRAAGADVAADGLVANMMSGLRPDPAMLDLVARVRREGHPVGLLSNQLGEDCYAGWDLDAMFDSVTLSAGIGARKPSRRAFRAACEALGARPEETVMVDDLEQNVAGAVRAGLAGVLHWGAGATERELWPLLGA